MGSCVYRRRQSDITGDGGLGTAAKQWREVNAATGAFSSKLTVGGSRVATTNQAGVIALDVAQQVARTNSAAFARLPISGLTNHSPEGENIVALRSRDFGFQFFDLANNEPLAEFLYDGFTFHKTIVSEGDFHFARTPYIGGTNVAEFISAIAGKAASGNIRQTNGVHFGEGPGLRLFNQGNDDPIVELAPITSYGEPGIGLRFDYVSTAGIGFRTTNLGTGLSWDWSGPGRVATLLDLPPTTATPANNVYGLRSTMTLDAASGGKSFGAVLGHNKVAAGSLYDYNMVRGVYGYADNYGDGVTTNLDGVYSVVTSRGNGRTIVGAGLWTTLDLAGSGIVDNYYGVRVNPATLSGGTPTLTNFYGVLVSAGIGYGAQNAWGFYNASTNWSYFGGKVGIGNSTPFADLQILRLTNGLGPVFMLQNQNGTSNSSGAIDFALAGSYAAPISSARIRGVRMNYPANFDSDLAFDTYDASWGGLREKMRLTARGNLIATNGEVSAAAFRGDGSALYNLPLPNTSWWASGSSNVVWRLVKNVTLTNVADVSACAYYPSNNSIFVVHNNSNGRITEWSLDGVCLRIIDWTSGQLPDAESITYLGGTQFAEVDEDYNRIFVFSITNQMASAPTHVTFDTNNCTIA